MKYCMDASAFIWAWNGVYTPKVFPGVWRELAEAKKHMVLIKPIFDEIDPVSSADKNLSKEQREEKYPLRMWLIKKKFEDIVQDLPPEVEEASLELEKKYEVSSDTTGADTKDIKLIAMARHVDGCVVTQEAKQKTAPPKRHQFKIPLICNKEGVRWIDLTGMLTELGVELE